MTIGGLRLDPPLVVAPMAGLTNIAFRRLIAELGGAGLYYSEMLSARALRHEKPANSEYLSIRQEGRPLCVQIFASQPDEILPAVERGEAFQPDAWDLNCGCPAPAIVKQGAGSALLHDLDKGRRMAAAMRRAVKGPLLFKVRTLPREESFVEFLRMLADEGADAVVVHGRHPGEKLGRPVRREAIALAARELALPVIGNGDVRSAEDAAAMLDGTGCRAVMIGRGVVERPWLLRRTALLFGTPLPPLSFGRKSEVFARMAVLLQECCGPPKDLYRLRAFAKYFSVNYKYGHQFWKEINSSATVAEATERAASFGARQSEEDRLYEETVV